MNTTSSSATLGQEPVSNFADDAADTAQGAVRATQSKAHAVLEQVGQKLDSVRDQAGPMINRLSSQAESAARRGADAVKETSAQLRERALRAQDTTVGYIRDEPVKAMLIAAATGAALMALLSMSSRSSRH